MIHYSQQKNKETEVNATLMHHPGCFSESFFTEEDDNGKQFKYDEVMKYSLLGNNVSNSVRYNHLCPWIKNRYNCATSKKKQYGETASDWKLILEKGAESCNLWNLIHDLGGPAGVGERIWTHHNLDHANKLGEKRTYNVVMLGNSYLRQVLEALECGWSKDISFSLMQKDATYGIPLQKSRNGAPIRMDEMGSMERMSMTWEGSLDENDFESKSVFYEKGLPFPSTKTHKFDDNVALVEFGGKIRFYYIFQPSMYENLLGVFQEKLQLELQDIDSLVFNSGQEKTISSNNTMREVFISTGVWEQRIIWPYETFRKIQERDIGSWFGADNPWITHPPDGHACMPGPPDDEVNLLLFLLYYKRIIQ